MKCPNCDNQMKHKIETRQILDLSGTADYNEYYDADVYKCPACKITNDDGKWKIPQKWQPTQKQVNTLLFINNRLEIDEKPLTKHQCWVFINKNFEKAKNTEQHHWYDNITDEDCEMMGLDASMFY